MNNKIIFLLAFLVVLPLTAQKQKATLYFRDGTELKGKARITKSGKIKFRKSQKSKKVFYDYKEIDKILIRKEDIDVMYQYKILKNKSRPLILEIIKEGEITLFRTLKTGHNPGMMMGPGGGAPMMTGGYSYSISNYYVSRDNESTVFHLGSKGTYFSKNFKKAASTYFKDCPKLVTKIQNKELKKRDIVEIVEFYNENCD